MKPHIIIDEMYVWGDGLIIKSLFLKDSSTLYYSSSFSILFYYLFSITPPLWRVFHIIYTCLGHLHRTLVHHLNLFSSICLIKYLPWLFVNGSGWGYTIQRSFSHKCGQKSCWNAFNTVVAAFPLDISVFLSSPYAPEVYPYRWRFLEGHPSPPLFPYATIYSRASPVIYSSSKVCPLTNRA